MIKGRDKKFWDVISQIDYKNIPILEQKLDDDEVREYKYSRKRSSEMIIIISALIIFWIYELSKSPDWIKEKPILTILISGFFLAGLITFMVTYFQDKVLIRLTINSITHKKTDYPWRSIKNMYLKTNYGGDNNSHDLVIEALGEEKHISLDSLNCDYKLILQEVGKFYGNWAMNNSKMWPNTD